MMLIEICRDGADGNDVDVDVDIDVDVDRDRDGTDRNDDGFTSPSVAFHQTVGRRLPEFILLLNQSVNNYYCRLSFSSKIIQFGHLTSAIKDCNNLRKT